jgi:hypothetical protein
VTPLLLAILGAAALGAGFGVLRGYGPQYRVARLLATVPRVSVAEAIALSRGDRPRYVRVDGRLDAEEEFEDADHRPLVLRRTRIEARRGGTWRTLEDGRQAVPFEIREGLDAIAVDGAVLDHGLVVIPRESLGTAGDIPDRVPAGLPATTPVRVRIEQLSSVEHATVLGVPVADGAGGARLTAGLGRPLVLTTLEQREAMRILAEGGAARPRLAAALLGGGLVLLVASGAAWLLGAVGVLAADPSPTPAQGGDPRSSGEGPGLVGDPGFALLVVGLIALASIVLTLGWIRLARTGDE